MINIKPRTRPLQSRQSCVFASFICVSVALAFVLLPLQVEQPRIQDSNELNVHFGYVFCLQ